MKLNSFKLILKCPDSQALLLAQEDFALRWHQRWALRGHLAICKSCTTTEQNIAVLRGQFARWRAYGADN